MRTLTDGLLAAQKASSGTPSISVVVGATDYSSRVLSITHTERPYGGVATILLDNSDKGIVTDHRGNKVVISYGYGAETKSPAPSLWVLTQRTTSQEGQLTIQLECIDIWLKLSLQRIFTGGGLELKSTAAWAGMFQPGMRVEGVTSGAMGTVLYVDSVAKYILVGRVSGTFTTETVRAVLFTTISMVVTSATSVGGGASSGWYGNKTIFEILQQITSGLATLQQDSSDGIVDAAARNPIYETQLGYRVIDIFQDLMNLTKCAARAEEDDKIHIFDITSAPGTPDYQYDFPVGSSHEFLIGLRDITETLPNTVYIYWAEPGATGMSSYAGSAVDDASVTRFGTISLIENFQVNTAEDAASVAGARLARIQKEATRGTVEVPMNCGQELFDYIKVVDARANATYYGWVGGLTRNYSEGVYRLTIELGGLFGAEGIPGEDAFPLPNLPPSIVPPAGQAVSGIASPTLGAYVANVVLTSVDYNHITWTAGNVKLADGRIQSILSGSLTLTATHYLYFIYGNTTLQNSTLYSDAVGADRGLVAVASIGSSAAVKAYVMNPHTDSILINTDKVMDGLVTELKLAALAVSEGKLQNLCISAGKIQTDAVTADKIFAGSVTAIKINVATLDAISANVGALTSGTINGVTIYAGNSAVVLDTYGISCEGSVMRFKYSGNIRGYVYAASDGFKINSYQTDLVLMTSSYLYPIVVQGDLRPSDNSYWYLGSEDPFKMWDTMFVEYIGSDTCKVAMVHRTDEFTCPLPTSNSALNVLRRVAAPIVREGDYGQRHYFMPEDFPEEMKARPKKSQRKIVKDADGKDKIEREIIESSPDIELTRVMGVTFQAVRELLAEVDSLKSEVAILKGG